MILELASLAEELKQMADGSLKIRRFLVLEWSSNRHLDCVDAPTRLLKIALCVTLHGESIVDMLDKYKL